MNSRQKMLLKICTLLVIFEWYMYIYIYYCVNSITFEVAVLASKIIMLSLPYHKIAFIFNFICQMQFLCQKMNFVFFSFTRIVLKLKYECFRIKLLMTVLSFTCYIMIIKSFVHWFLVEITILNPVFFL